MIYKPKVKIDVEIKVEVGSNSVVNIFSISVSRKIIYKPSLEMEQQYMYFTKYNERTELHQTEHF